MYYFLEFCLKNFKYIVSRIRVHGFLRQQESKILFGTNVRKADLTPVDVGLIPSPREYELENPFNKAINNDGIHFVGVDSEKHLIDVCINRIEGNTALVWVNLRLSSGSVYKLPSGDTRRVFVPSQNAFSSSGLQIKCLNPMRKWRISFNGLLEKCNSEGENELVHARFSFIWLAMSTVQELNLSYQGKDITDAFYKENYNPTEYDLMCLHELQDRYEQFGQMIGTVALNGETEKEFYFWSLRTRISDFTAWNNSVVTAKIFMYTMDGKPLKIESISIAKVLSNLTSGFSVSPYGVIKPISHCNFDIDLIGKNEKNVNFSCYANGEKKTFNLNFTGEDVALYIGPELQFKVNVRPFEVQINDGDKGYGVLHHSLNSNIKDHFYHSQPSKLPLVVLKDTGYSSCEKSVLLLEDEKCCSSYIAGGKGCSLALLTALSKKTDKFVVPSGFVISTNAFKNHLESNETIFHAVKRLKDISSTLVKGDLRTECNNCSQAFMLTELSQCLRTEIKKTLYGIYNEPEIIRFSVRSSAYGEDSEDLSAAGQMLTVLNVKGLDNVFKAIVQCWSSKFNFEAVQYARQNGQPILSAMAVVVQEMVSSETSGVMFTVDPVSGNPIYPCITANFGLGETVVSSSVTPDTVTLKRGRDQSLCVYEVNVGSKRKQLFVKDEGGVEEKNCDNLSENVSLSNEWAIRIGKAGILIEEYFGSPRDIEWAIYKDQLYLLQARPITTLHKETDFELKHDQDTPVGSLNDFWTTANVGEVYPGALSPLAISLVVGGMDVYGHIDQILRENQPNEFCPYFSHIMPITQRHVTMNLIDILFKINEKEVTPLQRAVEIALFGRPVITEELHQAGIKKYGYASKIKQYAVLLFIPVLIHSIPKALTKLEKEVETYRLPLEEYTSAKKTWDGIMHQMILFSKVCRSHGMTTLLSSLANMVLIAILKSSKKDFDTELYSDFATLLSDSGADSEDIPGSLKELAQTISCTYGKNFSSLPVNDAYNLLKNDVGPSGEMFENFLDKHGHRCAKEFDVHSKSWRMDSESLMCILKNMVEVSDNLNIAPKETLSTEAILSKLKTPMNYYKKKILNNVLPRCRRFVCLREHSKSLLIKTLDWLRMSCYHLGDLMVKEGMLPDSDLVFFLTTEEIQTVLNSQAPGLTHKAIRRKQLHQKLNELKFPEIIKGIPKPIPVKQYYFSETASVTLTGTPVCQGVVKGKAVVALTLEDASKIEVGDILITHATDIGWSPYFPLLSGVVTVLGGLISHGAVIAREFGLPCVVAVKHATTAFKTGDIVILNATEGTIMKVQDAS